MRAILYSMLILILPIISLAQVSLTVEGMTKMEGVLYIGLYNKKEGFTEINKTFKYWIVSVNNQSIELDLNDIDSGTYALSIFHDLNENGILDKNVLGIPLEIYGFSNNARRTFSAPSYQECSFTVREKTELVIKLQ